MSEVNEETYLKTIISDPSFDGFGQYIFPDGFYDIKDDMQIKDVDSLLPYHNYINNDTTIEVINYMKEAVNDHQIFYDIYSDEEKQLDPSKEDTGLFFFKGNPNAPTAIINAGGGFAYVGSIHESFPHALELSKQGYNAFALQYRTDANLACEDLAAAIVFLFEHQEELEIDMNDYSLWGGSAGARMAAYLGSYGTEGYNQPRYPRPKAIIMQYTGHSDYTVNDPATYVCIGDNDYIAPWRTMQQRIDNLNSLGINTEFHKYSNMSHGFGLGINTVAEGWINDAIAFWQKQIDLGE